MDDILLVVLVIVGFFLLIILPILIILSFSQNVEGGNGEPIPLQCVTPTGVEAVTTSSTSVRVNWNAARSPGLLRYKISLSQSSDFEEIEQQNEVGPDINSTGFQLLSPSTKYFVRVTSFSRIEDTGEICESIPSLPVSFVTDFHIRGPFRIRSNLDTDKFILADCENDVVLDTLNTRFMDVWNITEEGHLMTVIAEEAFFLRVENFEDLENSEDTSNLILTDVKPTDREGAWFFDINTSTWRLLEHELFGITFDENDNLFVGRITEGDNVNERQLWNNVPVLLSPPQF